MRSLEYSFPGNGYELIDDEFLLGDDILVAPVVTPKTYKREVVFPCGRWEDEDGNVFSKGSYMLDAPLDKLLWFRKVK